MNNQRMTKEKWGLVLSAIVFALDNDPRFYDQTEDEYTEDGEHLRDAFRTIFNRKQKK